MLKLCLCVLLLSLIACSAATAPYKEAGQTIQYKPHASVSMTYSMIDKIKLNEKLNIQISFKNEINVDDMIVKFHVNHHLKLLSETLHSLGIQPASELNTVNIVVIPQSEGLFYINVSATLVNKGQHQSRSFAIPVNVGSGDGQNSLKTNTIQKEPLTGGGIISMPAVERAK